MHAYNRTEADQTDSVVVCATKEEWQELADLVWIFSPELNEGETSLKFLRALGSVGVNY